MWCPDCGTEYRSGFHTCADCGVALVERPADDQPRARAEGGGLEPCLDSHDREEVSSLAGELERTGVPYVLQAGTALALLDGERLFGGRQAGSWEGRLWVHGPRTREAAHLLAQVRERLKTAARPIEQPEALDGETAEEYERRLQP